MKWSESCNCLLHSVHPYGIVLGEGEAMPWRPRKPRAPKQVDPFYVSREWRGLRREVLQRDPYCTRGCGAPSTNVDHVVSRRNGGTDTLDNLIGLCATHHSMKTAKLDSQWGQRKREAKLVRLTASEVSSAAHSRG